MTAKSDSYIKTIKNFTGAKVVSLLGFVQRPKNKNTQ